MITIGKINTFNKDGKAVLIAEVKISDDTSMKYKNLKKNMHKVHWRLEENYPPKEWNEKEFGLWFAVDEKYASYLCYETADAFVTALLWYAMATGSDIVSETKVSEKLLFSINNLLIPALCKESKGYNRISVKAPISREDYNMYSGVGTGMSCGIDSIYTLKKYQNHPIETFQLTHLTYFNNGAIFHPNSSKKQKYSLSEFYNVTDSMSKEKINNSLMVANECNLPLVTVESNIDKDFYRGAYGYTAVYRNCACVLSLQKLFKTYFCSSAGWPDYFDLTLSEGSEHYELLLCQCLSTESCNFIISDFETRVFKTKELSTYSAAMNHLDVCFNFENCGHCVKCYRTLITLDLLGNLDNFNKVFDVNKYKSNRNKAYGWLLYARLGNDKDDNAVFARDIYNLAKQKNVRFSFLSYAYMIKNMIIGLLVKVKHKIQYS